MGEGVEFCFRITGSGWAEGRLTVGTSAATAEVSYVMTEDPLGDLIRAVRALLEGAERARVWWGEEPGGYRWVLQRSGSEVRVKLLALDEYEQGAAEGEVLMDASCQLRDLGLAVASGARDVRYESDSPRRSWRILSRWSLRMTHRLPTDDLADLAALERLLAAHPA